MSLVTRKITATFILKSGNFQGTSSNILTIGGLRISASIEKIAAPGWGNAQFSIFGLTASQMNQLSTLGMNVDNQYANSVIIQAGDDINGMHVVFQGTIWNAWADYDNQPNVRMNISAVSGLDAMVAKIPPLSYGVGVPVATLMQNIANQVGYNFENNGVTGTLNNAYFPGGAGDQMLAVANASGINFCVDVGSAGKPTLAIWPKNGFRNAQTVLISPNSGLFGYPTFQLTCVVLRCIFNPAIVFGSQVTVASSIPAANGTWPVYQCQYYLESETPGGKWEMVIMTRGKGPLSDG